MPKSSMENIKLQHTNFSALREAKALPPTKDGAKRWKCVMLTEGKGNVADRHYYSQACVDSPVTQKALNGKPCYIDHPSAIEEQSLPERSVKQIGGWWDDVHPEGNALIGTLRATTTEAGKFLESFINDCLAYAAEHPGENLGGFSINAGGPVQMVEIDGEDWKQVDEITEGFSTDLVTLPARGGQVVMAMQSQRLPGASGDALKIAEALLEKIEAGATDQKDLRRQVTNLITALHGNAPAKEGEKMAKKLTSAQLKEAKKKLAEGMGQLGEDDTKKIAKVMHAYHSNQAEKCEGEGDAVGKAHHEGEAEKFKKMSGEGEGEAEGDLLIKHKGGSNDDGDDDGDGDGNDMGDDDANVDESEAHRKEAEAHKKEAEGKKVEKEKESLRRQVGALSAALLERKLQESGLPEAFHARVKRQAVGKTQSQVDLIIEETLAESQFVLQESGAGYPTHRGDVSTATSTLRESTSVLKKHGLLREE